MSTTELPKNYDPAAVEAETYQFWIANNCFKADPTKPGDPYCIVIPPPNVTGALHLGHAINNTLQDILTRMHRMAGFNTLWVPGLDHAGIATQAVVEKQLKEKENKTRHDVGREGLVERIWVWKQQYGDRILEQLKRLGASCDWSRARFTLDDQCAKAVRQTFFKLFKDGLVYRGKRLVNWDIHLQTSISDDEIYHETVKTSMWHIRYPIVVNNAGTSGHATEMVVATTRPETLLGDTAVAVHSQDPRWNWAIGKSVKLPLTDRFIPIIADDILVDPKFGSGVVKVTPAHDPNDYAVYQRHLGKPDQIELINILNPTGTLNENAGAYAGMKRDAARAKVVADLESQGLLAKVEPYETQVGHSDRSKTAVEPYLSDQWFVKMAPLAEPALDVVRDGTIKFFPERHAQQYLSWLGEKRDWPISRQLWWGHRIPVWTKSVADTLEVFHEIDQLLDDCLEDVLCNKSNLNALVIIDSETGSRLTPTLTELNHGLQRPVHLYLSLNATSASTKWERNGWVQDPDVLDTWFSSALWPHSTLGWPDSTPDLAKWYPTTVLLTGRDIITLWVARMVMMGMYNMGGAQIAERKTQSEDQAPADSALCSEFSAHRSALSLGIPFHHVAINPTILDGKGERMSKSKGNGVDPVDIIDTHGADALRFTLTTMATETQDVRLPVKKLPDGRNTSDKFDLGRNFCNKLWNAARFAFSNLESAPPPEINRARPSLISLADRWIISRFNFAVNEANQALAAYRFDQYAKACYDFFWRDFCDWYVEVIKPAMKDPAASAATADVLAAVLDGALRLMHPMIPFITERLWWNLNTARSQRGVPGLPCPYSPQLIVAAWPTGGPTDAPAEAAFAQLQEIIIAIRNLRSEYKVDPKKSVKASISAPAELSWLIRQEGKTIELLATCELLPAGASASANAARAIAAGCEIIVEGLVDPDAEKQRVAKHCESLKQKAAALRGRLSNEAYTAKAPPHLVQQSRDELSALETEMTKLGCPRLSE